MFGKLKYIKTTRAVCQKCALGQSRTKSVFSDGVPNSKMMLIGEAPDFMKIKKGFPL